MKTPMNPQTQNMEHPGRAQNGWLWVLIVFLLLAATVYLVIQAVQFGPLPHAPMVVGGVLACLFFGSGFFTLQPNEAAVLILFGAYKGTIRSSGFWWANPLLKKQKISLRARNLDGDKLKVNDLGGNPIEIAAVVVWRVEDTAQASFDVDDYEHYVKIQSESAIRHLTRSYYYDGESHDVTLRSSTDEVMEAMKVELQERFGKAGVVVEEARITHLAYAPEIAHAMLRRQQAEAIIAARQKIVHGAVSMVEMALDELAEKKVVEFDDEKRAAMVSNLLVVLCGDADVQPVVNTGTLYT